jgi:hypothetical protein
MRTPKSRPTRDFPAGNGHTGRDSWFFQRSEVESAREFIAECADSGHAARVTRRGGDPTPGKLRFEVPRSRAKAECGRRLKSSSVLRRNQVLLTEPGIRRSIKCVEAAFPCFRECEHSNEINDSYSGFSLWGEFVPDPNEPMPRSYFITFDTHEATWTGHLTIGKHSYFWSSADCGDAHLLDTSPCGTLEEAITTLKSRMADLFAAISGRAAESSRP